MSGGRWNYSNYFEDTEDQLRLATNIVTVVREIERTLDWGLSGDSCPACARLAAIAALEQLFEDRCGSTASSLALLRDGEQNLCPECAAHRLPENHTFHSVDRLGGKCALCKKGVDGHLTRDTR